VTTERRQMPDDLRVALGLFSRAGAVFDALGEAHRAALIDWIEDAAPGRERGDRVAEIAVRANAGDLADLVTERRLRQRD